MTRQKSTLKSTKLNNWLDNEDYTSTTQLVAIIRIQAGALERTANPTGAFSQDRLTHVENCINETVEISKDAQTAVEEIINE